MILPGAALTTFAIVVKFYASSMFKFTLFFVVALTTFSLADAQCNETCATNGAECSTCGNCDPSCTDPDPSCVLYCITGCFCPEGTVRNSSNYCIDPSQCNKC